MVSLKSFKFRNVFLGGSKTNQTLVRILEICVAGVKRTRAVGIRLDLVRGDNVLFQAFPHTLLIIAAMQLAFVNYKGEIIHVCGILRSQMSLPAGQIFCAGNSALYSWLQIMQNAYVGDLSLTRLSTNLHENMTLNPK